MNRVPPPPTAVAAPPAREPLAFGPFVLDSVEGRLLAEGVAVPLVGRPLQVLDALARRPGRLVGRDELLDLVWGHRHVSDSVLKVALNALRQALGDDARAPRYVETVPRRGFRFIAELRPLVPAVAATVPDGAIAAAASDTPATPSPRSDRPTGNLPPPRPGLVGRQAELAQLLRLMQDHRVVTLVGLGGLGKTRLALAAALDDMPADGTWLVRLEALPSMADGGPERQRLLAALAAPLPLPAAAAASTEALGRALAPLTLRLLLDNAEHVTEPLAALLGPLLNAAPRLRLLVTSQRALRLPDEQVMPLAPLELPARVVEGPPPPEAVPAPGPDPSGYAAGRLLCERIARAQPGWQADAADWADIAAICRQLDGVPLALELAAARVPLLGLAAVRARLATPLALLTRRTSDGEARHRSLQAALDWTVALLDDTQRRALQQLSLFAGSFSVEAAEHVLMALAGGDALDLLQDLLDRSLVSTEPWARGHRLRLFDSVRQHAHAALAASGEQAVALRRLACWAEARALVLEQADFGTPQLQWLPEARADAELLRPALEAGLDRSAGPEDRERAARTVIALVMPWSRLGRQAEVMGWLAALRAPAEAPAGEALDDALRCELDRAWGTLATYMPQIPARQALSVLEAAHAAFGDAPPRWRAYLARYAVGALHMRLHQTGPMREGMAAAQALVAADWGPLARRHARWLDIMLARDDGRITEYRDRSRQLGDELQAVGALAEAWTQRHAEAQAAFVLGDIDGAAAVLDELVASIGAAGSLHEQAPVVAMAAVVHLRRNADARALALARQAVRGLQAHGMVWWMADALPWAAWHQGRHDDARRLQAWADARVAERGDQRGPVFTALRTQFGEFAGSAPPEGPAPVDEAAALALALGNA